MPQAITTNKTPQFEVSHGVGEDFAQPVMWLYEGNVEHNGKSYSFWYQHDERDDERVLESNDWDLDAIDGFDIDAFEDFCENKVQAQMKMDTLRRGYHVDVSYQNGVLRSSKEMYQVFDLEHLEHFCVWHGIDNTEQYFTKSAALEVLEGTRDAWDGDITR